MSEYSDYTNLMTGQHRYSSRCFGNMTKLHRPLNSAATRTAYATLFPRRRDDLEIRDVRRQKRRGILKAGFRTSLKYHSFKWHLKLYSD